MSKEDRYAVQLKQGRPMYGIELKVVDDSGNELPKDGFTIIATANETFQSEQPQQSGKSHILHSLPVH